MAEKSGPEKDPLALRRKIAQSRELVVRDLGGLRYELNFPLKFKKAFQRNTALWIGAAVTLGLCVALLRARTRKIYVGPSNKKIRSPNKSLFESGALLGAIKLAMTVLQPIVVSHFAKKGSKEGRDKSSRRHGW
jgi:hypothetical protein